MKLRSLLVCLLIFPVTLLAAGPEKVATLDRDLWPYAIDTPAQFDKASNAEIQMQTRVISTTSLLTEADIKAFTGLKTVNVTGVKEWLTRTQTRLLENHQHACGNGPKCARNWRELQQLSKGNLEHDLEARWKIWAQQSQKFHQRYLYEQVRLAALFPRITSEIDRLSSQEVNGFELKDGDFLLTYDDGPSPHRTAPLIRALKKYDIHAFFFVLGESLDRIKPAADAYQDQCLASHGYQHQSHAKWQDWQQSLADTRVELAAYQPGPYWFRPPYGQRHQALLTDLQHHNETVMLWNIDSQDWNKKLSEQQVADRVITLMLLWRRGIILYHDIHSRAQNNLPMLNGLVTQSDRRWVDCRHF
ncbi:polysaccharide deacetylase family protein [Ferrimonas kyonanensis]|uniref:polysaccharide deacetylase family protein n=1 Tax=Ferrimonas kyonanensis TaxID=364763 RepID=UPI0003FCCE2D|nr:polysaccharide deacetylase family protein [Ferrimonas kyonanensis]